MGFKGNLETFNLADVLQNLAQNQQTGTLKILSPTAGEMAIYFLDGEVKFLARGAGKVLVTPAIIMARGDASAQQVQEALQATEETGASLLQALVELGHLTVSQAGEVIRKQVEEEIYELFSWEQANFEFTEGAPPPGYFEDQRDTSPPPINISGLIMEAARRLDEWERVRELVKSDKEIYVVAQELRAAAQAGKFELAPLEEYVLTLCDGTRDVSDLVAASSLSRFEVASVMAQFVTQGLVRPATVEELSAAVEPAKEAGERGEMAKLYERILALGGENFAIREQLAEVCAELGDTQRAAAHLGILAEAKLAEKNEAAALDIYRRIVQLVPRHATARERLADLCVKTGHTRQAARHYGELMKLHQEAKRHEEAKDACLRALDSDPENLDLRRELVNVYVQENDRRKAAEQLELIGDALHKQGKNREAAEAYKRILTLDRALPHIKTKLNNVLLSDDQRRQRRIRRLLVGTALLALVGLVTYVLWRERSHAGRARARLGVAQRSAEIARWRLEEAAELNEKGEFENAIFSATVAKECYQEAEEQVDKTLAEIQVWFSPGVERELNEAKEKFIAGRGKAEAIVVRSSSQRRETASETFRRLMALEKAGERSGALSLAKALVENQYLDEIRRRDVQNFIGKLQQELQKINDFQQKNRESGGKGWASVEAEIEDKRRILEEFPEKKDLAWTSAIKFPLLLATDRPGVTMSYAEQEGYYTLIGALGPRPTRWEYDPAPKRNHHLKFELKGYRTETMSWSGQYKSGAVAQLTIDMKRAARFVFHFGEEIVSNAVVVGDVLYALSQAGNLCGFRFGDRDRLLVNQPLDLPPNWKIAGDIAQFATALYLPLRTLEKSWVLEWDTVTKKERKPRMEFPGEIKGGIWVAPAQIFSHRLVLLCVTHTSLEGRPLFVCDVNSRQILEKIGSGGATPYRFSTVPIIWDGKMAQVEEGSSFFVVGGTDGKIHAWLRRAAQLVEASPVEMGRRELLFQPLRLEEDLLWYDKGGRLWRHAPKTGTHESIQVTGTLATMPLIHEGKLFFGTKDGAVYLVGELKQDHPRRLYKFASGVSVRPAVEGAMLFAASDGGEVAGINWQSGEKRWSYQHPTPVAFVAEPYVHEEGTIYLLARDGHLIVLDALH